jgi:DNA-binding beta-propeller fold protein YncE
MEESANRATLDRLLALSPTEFEFAVARLLSHFGYGEIRRTGGAGDLGVDIVCQDEHGGLVAVQCKRYAVGNTVTSPNIQQFFGMLVHHGARQGIYITTSTFTKSAFDLAAARDIRTIEGTELAVLFAAYPGLLGLGQHTGRASPLATNESIRTDEHGTQRRHDPLRNPPRFARAWGGCGTGIGEFSYPWGVAVDSSGLVYVADYGNNRIQVFDDEGRAKHAWGSEGSKPGQFHYPRNVSVDPLGRICVADGPNYRIQIFRSTGTFIEEWPCPHPDAIGVDGDGCVYVASHGSIRIDPEWTPSSVTKFSPHGEVLMHWEISSEGWEPDDVYYDYWGIAVAPNGHIYVGLVPDDASAAPVLLQRWDPEGNLLAQWTGAESVGQDLTVPKGLATDQFGNVLVANSLAHRVQKFTPEGEFLWQVGGRNEDGFAFNNLTAVTVTDSGDLYVTDAGNHLAFQFSPPAQ